MMNKAAAIIIVILFCGGLSFAGDLNNLLERHRQALGSTEAITGLKSMAMYGTVNYQGVPGRIVVLVRFPYEYNITTDLGVLQVMGCDGTLAWAVDANGLPRTVSAEEQKPIISELYFSSYSYLFDNRLPGDVFYRGDTIIGGADYEILILHPWGGDSLALMINGRTGLIDYRFDRITGLDMITSYSDYRDVAGLKLPFRSEATVVEHGLSISSFCDSVLINPELPDSLFLMPGTPPVDYDFGESSSVIIPIRQDLGHAFVEVMVNGAGPFSFLLDTGAGASMLSDSLADLLGIDRFGRMPARGIGGFDDASFGRIDSIDLGQARFYGRRLILFDFRSLKSTALSRLDGILGYDFFSRLPMRLDFDRQELVLFSPGRLMPAIGGIPLELFYQIPVMEVSLDGQPIRVIFDLGAQGPLQLFPHARAYARYGSGYDTLTVETKLSGIGGTKTVRLALGERLQLGGQEIKRPEVSLLEPGTTSPLPDYIEGILGLDILAAFNWTVDFPGRRLYPEARSQ